MIKSTGPRTRAVLDLFFSNLAGAGFGMTNPAGAGARARFQID